MLCNPGIVLCNKTGFRRSAKKCNFQICQGPSIRRHLNRVLLVTFHLVSKLLNISITFFLLDLTRKPINVHFSHKHIKVMALFPFPSRGFKRSSQM